jgi:hypothetical protein
MMSALMTPVWKGSHCFWLCCAVLLAGCEPTIRVEAPKEPITINLNITLDANVRLKIEEQARNDINKNPGLF